MVTSNGIRSRQSSVSKEGREFQSYIQYSLNNLFKTRNRIWVLNGKEITNDEDLKDLFSFPVRGFKTVWGDVDLVAKNLDTTHPIALISCKLSLHGRFTETLFYSKVYKEKIPDLKVVFATPDKGRQGSNKWETEWGSPTKPTKDRFLAETFLDGVYIDNNYLLEKWGVHGTTVLGGKIRPISQLASDLIEWSKY